MYFINKWNMDFKRDDFLKVDYHYLIFIISYKLSINVTNWCQDSFLRCPKANVIFSLIFVAAKCDIKNGLFTNPPDTAEFSFVKSQLLLHLGSHFLVS